MMKYLRHILLCVLALAALTVSCVDPLEPVISVNSNIHGDALVFSPKVLGITPATKTTPGEDDRGENTVTRIDVFVYQTTGGTSTFHKHYPIGDGTQAIQTSVDYLLESNWRTNYTEDDTYRVYAIANINANKLRNPVFPINDQGEVSLTEEELKKLTSESDATIAGQYGYTCYDIVRLKNPDGSSPAAGSQDHHIGSKLFLMDGMVDGWKIKDGAAKQYITTKPDQSVLDFNLSRAAAKFRVELNFSEAFKESLGEASDHNRKFTQIEYWDPEEKTKVKTVRVTTIGKLTDESDIESVVSGGPLMKFSSFLKATYDVAPEDKTASSVPTATQQNTFRDNNLWDSQSFYEFSYRTPDNEGGYTYPYITTTYSYAFSWEAGEAAEKAPALAVSVVYTTYTQKYAEDGVTKVGGLVSDGGVTNYYRIPLVNINKETNEGGETIKEPVNSVERNYYYQVTAEINTMGTSTTDIEPNKVHLKYKVIPWPDAPTEKTEAQTIQLLYFVPEKEYSLRGDDLQSVYLQYFTPKSDPIAVNSHYYQATPKIKNVEVYYYNQSGQKHYLQQKTSTVGYSTDGYKWVSSTSSGADASIEVLTNDQQTGGRFYVASTALENRSVKYIEFDAEVNFGYAGGQTVTQHIIVKHYPLDNLNSILGAWSSRWNEGTTSTTITEYSFNPSADGWDSWTDYTDIECTFDEYNYAEPEHRSTSTQTGTRTADREDFLTKVTTNTDRANANSETNAVDGYFGTNPSNVRVNDNEYTTTNPGTASSTANWDYWTNYSPRGNYHRNRYYRYKYGNYYTKAEVTVYKARRYRRTRTINQPSTGDWVDWDKDEGETYSESNARYTYDGSNFEAKVYNFDDNKVYAIAVTRSGNYNNYQYTYNQATTQGTGYINAWYRYSETNGYSGNDANMTGLTNNHMYIIQISKAGKDKYGNEVILGRPKLDNNYQSDDNTVSPAFMIASQLGAVASFGTAENAATNAARHCHTYMEVAQNGRRFTGWRLPTQAEINYIIQYQTDLAGTDVFDYVLTGYYYYTLNKGADGNRWAIAYTADSQGSHAVRCIRDLTPEEVIELNGPLGTITEASY